MDVIGDMLSIIKNAQMTGKESAELPHSRLREELARLLEKEGYLSAVKVFKPEGKSFKMLSLSLKYLDQPSRAGVARRAIPFINHLKRISRPGKRIYARKDELPRPFGGKGVVIVSTSRGLMTAKEARAKDLGGELLCEVW